MSDATTPSQLGSQHLRREVQALRALAATAVVLYHFWPGRVPGGYVGVDVFFVISGFLITGHLIRELRQRGRLDLLGFWARRARRLLPASYLVIGLSLLGVITLMPRVLWTQNLRELMAASLYAENWRLTHDAVDYLASSNTASVIQHYWTLGVEEQFYLVWPLILLGAFALGRRRGAKIILVVVTTVTVASFGLALHLTTSNASMAYFGTPGRMWEFGLGALLALALSSPQTAANSHRSSEPRHLRIIASWTGLAAVLVAVFTYSDATTFPGLAAILPTVGVVLVIWAGMPSGLLSPAPLMALKPVQWIGEISYALYLWHWPLLILGPYALNRDLGLPERVLLLALTFVLAWASTRLVEDPIRNSQRVRQLRHGATLAIAGTVAVALVIPAVGGIRSVEAQANAAERAASALVAQSPRCFGAASMVLKPTCHNPDLANTLVPTPDNVRKNLVDYPGCFAEYTDVDLLNCRFGAADGKDAPEILLIGDSHAQMFLPSLVALAEQGRLSVTVQLKAACPWADPPPSRSPAPYAKECGQWRSHLGRWLDSQKGAFDLVLTNGRMDNLPGTPRQQATDLAAAWRPVAEAGVQIAAIKDNPSWATDPNICLSATDIKDITPRTCGVTKSKLRSYVDPQVAAVKLVKGASLVSLDDLYCHDDWCPAIAGGVNMYRDISHLSVPYANSLGPYLYRRLVGAGLLEPQS